MLYKNTHFKKEQTVGGSMEHKIVNPDLQEEREKSNFDARELQSIVDIEDGF